jgi:hypothetical protein
MIMKELIHRVEVISRCLSRWRRSKQIKKKKKEAKMTNRVQVSMMAPPTALSRFQPYLPVQDAENYLTPLKEQQTVTLSL